MRPLDKRWEEMENPRRIGYLIAGFLTEELTLSERDELDRWVSVSDENMRLFDELTREEYLDAFLRWQSTRTLEKRLEASKEIIRKQQRRKRFWIYAAAAAAVTISAMALGWYLRPSPPVVQPVVQNPFDIPPGAARAELRLANGKRILLEEQKDTTIGTIHIQDGLVSYTTSEDTTRHEIWIPQKGFYQLQLPDGTKVWLNSESSIRYPASFKGAERLVSVTGETYFQVAKDAAHPFVVLTATQRLVATGTSFNINCFDGWISLEEGRITVDGKQVRPGEQINRDQQIREANWRTVSAWTRNEFDFRHLTIQDIKPLLERWYGIPIVIEQPNDYHFYFTIERSVPLSRILEILEQTKQVHFVMENAAIHVRP